MQVLKWSGLGVLIGAALTLILGVVWHQRTTSTIVAESRAAAAQREAALQADIARLKGELSASKLETAEATRRAAEATQGVKDADATAVRKVATARRPASPAARAAAVVALVGTSTGSVRPTTVDGAPGWFLVTEAVLIDLQAAKTASVAGVAQRRALDASIQAERARAAAFEDQTKILERTVERWRLGYESERGAREKLEREWPEPSWYEHPAVWFGLGVAAAGAAAVGIATMTH